MLVTRDSFAREELHRELVCTNSSCDWCRGHRRTAKLWRYSVEPDSIGSRVSTLNGLFCSASCFRSYHF